MGVFQLIQADPSQLWWLVGFLVLVIVPGSLIGYRTAPGDWYARLNKPSFNPPNRLFAPVWLILYVLIATAGWIVWVRAPLSIAMVAWGVQLLLNWLWSPVFFALHRPWLAVLVIAALDAAVVVFLAAAWSIDPVAALLFVPYLAWIAFATLLNVSLARLN